MLDTLNLILSISAMLIGVSIIALTLPYILEDFKEKECDCEARSHGCTGNDKNCPYNGYKRKHDPCYKCPDNPSEKCENCPTRIEYKLMTEKDYKTPKQRLLEQKEFFVHGNDCVDCEERFSCDGNCKYIQEVERCDKN